MKPASPLKFACRRTVAGVVVVATLAAAGATQVLAASVLADAPLFTASSTAVKPNLMFILDDSGSMQWDFMPDAADVLNRRMFGRTSAQCNGLAYDPDQTYTAPYRVDPTTNAVVQQDAALVAAWTRPDPALQTVDIKPVRSLSANNGVSTGQLVTVTITGDEMYFGSNASQDTVTVFKDASNYFVGQVETDLGLNAGNQQLSIRIVAVIGTITTATTGMSLGKGEPVTGEYYTYNGAPNNKGQIVKEPRLNWYTATGAVNTGGTFYAQCTALVSGGGSAFTRVTVATLDADKQQNYANWAKFYRTRIRTMQSSSSVAFKDIGERYRIGYSAISQPSAAAAAADFLHVDDFKPAQKKLFYDRLASAKPGTAATPLRGALAKAGQYFAKKALNQDKDPIQFSCQRNFAILSTDGFWNTGNGRGAENTSRDTSPQYGAVQLDRTTPVGNADNNLPRPMADGNTLKVTTTETWSTVQKGLYEFRTGSNIVKSTQVTDTGTGVLRIETETTVTRGASCRVNNRNGNFPVTTTRTRTVTALAKRTVTTEVRTPTITTTQKDSSQETDHTRTIVVDNGATTSDQTRDVPQPRVDGDTVAVKTETGPADAGTALPAQFTKVSELAGDWGDPSSSVGNCVQTVNPSGPTVTAGPSAALSSFTYGAPRVSVQLADRTEPFTPSPSERWATSPAPTTKDTDKLVTQAFESTGGQLNTLADVAAYYYEQDLRNGGLQNCLNDAGKDVCADNVPGNAVNDPYKSFGDSSRKQHMTTFTLGLGVSGSLKYDPNYITMRSGDFHDIVTIAKNWPNTTAGQNSTVDDLWHAAVNGRGQYFSAGNPTALTSGLNTALAAIDTVIGSASAASTSSLQPVAGDNDIFVAQFTTKAWTGDVLAFKIDPNSGLIDKASTWSAAKELEDKSLADRRIYYRKPGDTALRLFNYDNLSADNLTSGNFDGFCNLSGAGTTNPTQCATLQDKSEANRGVNLVNYLRGDKTMSFYRTRDKRLGDVINASPLFVGKPGFKYTEHDYATYAAAKANRKQVVLAAANDGMLHAFDRENGNELWAFIPSLMIPNLHKLADEGFTNNHSYFVDGSPQIADVWVESLTAWRTIVVGGLNKGGRGYYALDVTDPANPVFLWEFSHANLGYSFGNPIVTKRSSGRWIVAFGSGYDNVSPGDGNGHLFVLDAYTGREVIAGGIPTLDAAGNPVGSAGAPSGLARINSWVDTEADNTSLRFYGGDELGNVWRFDLDGRVEPRGGALLLAQLRKDSVAQPITTRPVVAAVSYNGTEYPVVFVGTGSYQRLDDAKSKTLQSFYAIKDPLTNTPLGDIRASGTLVQQTITDGLDQKANPTRTSTTESVDWGAKAGWFADFPVAGERVTVNPVLALDTVFVGSGLPKDEDCSVGGDSFLYQFNINNGQSSALYVGSVLVQGLTVVQLTTGSNAGAIDTIITRSDGSLQTNVGAPPAVTGVLRRSSWRELID